MSRPTDPNLARAAALNGMTVEAWLAHCDQVEAAEKSRRATVRMMQTVPAYREVVAA